MTALLIIGVILLAAILITLLTAWKIVGIVLGIVVSLIAAIYVLDDLFGKSGVQIGFALAAVLIFGLMFYSWLAEKRDKERPPATKKLTAKERQAELTRLREESRAEEDRRRAELAALRKDIQDRSR